MSEVTKSSYMTKEQIRSTIKDLAKSQGFYSRIERQLSCMEEEDPEEYKEVMETLYQQHFKDAVDMILYFEY